MNIKLLAIVAACSGLFVVACGDDSSSGGAGGGGNGNGGTAAGAGGSGAGTTDGGAPAGGGGAGGGEALTCETGCALLFSCSLEGTPQNCPGYTAADEDAVVGPCLELCPDMMAILAILDPDDCPGTIETIKALNADFANSCENGFSEGGGGAGGN